MSKFHRRFEPLEPRFLLSSAGLVDNSFAEVRTKSCISPAAIQSQELPAATVEDRPSELLSPTDGELSVSSQPVSSQPVSLPPVSSPTVERLSTQESTSGSKVELSGESRQVIEKSDVTATAVKEVRIAVSSDNILSRDSLSSESATLQISDVAVKDVAVKDVAVKEVVSRDATVSSKVLRTLVADRISLDKPVKTVAIRTSPTLVVITGSNATIKTLDDVRSLDNKEQWSLTAADATAEVAEERKPTTTDQGTSDTTDISANDVADEQEPDKDKALAKTDAGTADSDILDTEKVWLAVERKSDTSEKTASANAGTDDPEAKFNQQTPTKSNRSTAQQTHATVATSSPDVSRQTSNQVDQGNIFAKTADCIFSEEQSESGGQWASSSVLPAAEGALLLVTLGKPLTRLAAGDGRVDAANVDCGLSATARTTFDRSRRNRRKTAEARDRWQRSGDARDLTWLPPEKLPTEISHETTEPTQDQPENQPSAADWISSYPTDLAMLSHLGVWGISRPDVPTPKERSESPDSGQPFSVAFSDYAALGAAAAAVTLTGTISVLAIDRHRRINEQQHRVKLPMPAYNGRTLARA